MQATRDIKRRIKSINNTKKITKAMELVAAAKMRKTVAKVQMTKAYAHDSWDLARRLAGRGDKLEHPLLAKRPIKKAAVIAISANKGLCGGFNQQVYLLAMKTYEDLKKKGAEVDFITLGKKCARSLAGAKKNIAADFKKEDIALSITEVEGVASMIIKDFSEKKYDSVWLVYTDFRSSLKQVASSLELLPFSYQPDSELGKVAPTTSGVGIPTSDKNKGVGKEEKTAKEESGSEYLFEPSEKEVLNYLLPRLVTIELYQAVLESNASEHSARMVAMRNANDAASEMVDELNLFFNKMRQSSITQEIAEISAGQLSAS